MGKSRRGRFKTRKGCFKTGEGHSKTKKDVVEQKRMLQNRKRYSKTGKLQRSLSRDKGTPEQEFVFVLGHAVEMLRLFHRKSPPKSFQRRTSTAAVSLGPMCCRLPSSSSMASPICTYGASSEAAAAAFQWPRPARSASKGRETARSKTANAIHGDDVMRLQFTYTRLSK